MCSIILSANSNNFTSFQFGFLFSFPSLNSVAKTSETVLHNSDDSGHLCLAPNLRGNDFSLSPLKMVLWVCHIWPLAQVAAASRRTECGGEELPCVRGQGQRPGKATSRPRAVAVTLRSHREPEARLGG